MDSNITSAIIGVGASISVFIATVIADMISDKIKNRNEIKKKYGEELCENTRKLANIITNIRYKNNKCIEIINGYSQKNNLEPMDVQNIQFQLYDYMVNFKELLDNYYIVADFIDNHGIILSDFIKYSIKVRKISTRLIDESNEFLPLNDYIGQHVFDMFRDNSFNKLKIINDKYNAILDELFFYYYNLSIEIQNSIYSKYFRGKKLEKIQNNMYEKI